MLWGQAVVHRKHRTATGVAELTAQDIVGFDVANHPTTAMEVNQCRQDLVGSDTHGAVFTHRHLHPAQVGQMVMHMRHDGRVRLRQSLAQNIKISRFFGRQRVDRWHTAVHHEL